MGISPGERDRRPATTATSTRPDKKMYTGTVGEEDEPPHEPERGVATRLSTSALLAALPVAFAVRCTTPGLPTLHELAHKYGSGKATWSGGGLAFVGGRPDGRKDGSGHGFAHTYARALESTRMTTKRVLEFGVYMGASIKMWQEYFPNAEIVGVDWFAGLLGHGERFKDAHKFYDDWQAGKHGQRIQLIEANQGLTEDLQRVVSTLRNGAAFDLIVDDASHKNKDQQQTFGHMFPLLRPGGIYVLEDLHSSLQPYDMVPASVNTTVARFLNYEKTGSMTSPLITAAQTAYLKRWLEGCQRIAPMSLRGLTGHRVSYSSQTSVCYKRLAPVQRNKDGPGSVRTDVMPRLYNRNELKYEGRDKALPTILTEEQCGGARRPGVAARKPVPPTPAPSRAGHG